MSDVVKLMTAAERDAEAAREYEDAVRDEALGMLERAAAMVRERGCAGIAISVVFNDGNYGRLTPVLTTNMAALIGSVATTQHDLILRTLTEDA